ncbi:MAG: hypothetical protein J0I12_07545 [Candidatus Eremiobacteraeota bacterium]|nr:hypothetical protein [Candidatus Eremiobacteraeota bacterium]
MLKFCKSALLALSLCLPAVANDGRILVVYPGATTPEHQIVEKIFKDLRPFEAMADSYNAKFFFPRDVLVVVAETGQANCWYQPDKHRVYISYEFLDFLLKLFRAVEPEKEARGDALNTLFFVALHEMGHALIGELDIPTTGREEDAVDDFACLTVHQVGGSAREQALAAARWFAIMGARDNKDLPYWDEHSLDLQRFYGILGLMYGADPNRFMFAEKIVPERTLKRHVQDYPKKLDSWERLLAPHFRKKLPRGQNLKI